MNATEQASTHGSGINGSGAGQYIATEITPQDRAQIKAQHDLELALESLNRFGDTEAKQAAADAVRRIAGKAMARK